MATNKHIFLIIIIPFIIWGGYFLFQDYFTPIPTSQKIKYSVNEQIVMKYSKLENKLREYKNKFVDTSILNKILQTKKEKTKNKKSIYRYNLRYIIITNNKKIADINGKIVTIGDRVDGALVIYITNNKVEIKTNKGIKWLYLE